MNKKYTVYHNLSMIEDERMTEYKRMAKRYKCNPNTSSAVGAPIGHVYSVMVEELNIEKPDLNAFIKELNTYIINNHDSFACLKSPTDNLYSKTLVSLYILLQHKIFEENLEIKSAKKIIRESIEDYDYISIIECFLSAI